MKVVSALPLPNYRLEVFFEDGVSGIVKLETFVQNGVFSVLKDEALFNQVKFDQSAIF